MHKTLVRKLTVAGLVGAVAMSAAARELTPEEALLRAGLFRSENTGIFKSRSANNTRLAHTVTLPELNSAAFYVFNYGNGNGYVVVSGDDRLRRFSAMPRRVILTRRTYPRMSLGGLTTIAGKSRNSSPSRTPNPHPSSP